MATNLTCTQVSALLSFYIDDKLSNELKEFVKAHLKICPVCREKYETLKSMMTSLREIKFKMQMTDDNDEFLEFKTNLSAYVDNELSDSENIRVKKNIIANPKAREYLESTYNLKKILRESFDKTKNDSKIDYSKNILRRIDIQEEVYAPDIYKKVIAIFVSLFAIFTCTAFILLWI